MCLITELNTLTTLFFQMSSMNGMKFTQNFKVLVDKECALIKFVRSAERKIFNINEPFEIKF